MFRPLRTRYPELEAHDEGESHHASVAAASVIAKVLRDELFEQIRGRYVAEFGEIGGGGYCNAGTRGASSAPTPSATATCPARPAAPGRTRT